MKRDIQQPLLQLLSRALEQTGYAASLTGESKVLEFFPATGHGDIANNVALKLGSILKRKPMDVAGEIVAALTALIPASPVAPYLESVKAEGAGFINFYLKAEYFYEVLEGIAVEQKAFVHGDAAVARRLLIEFVSANPTGPLSVAHARQAAVGDALANIMRFCGYEVAKEYYLNDEGNQIVILGNSVKTRLAQLRGEAVEFAPNYYQGDYIVDMARQIHENKIQVHDFSAYAADAILAVIKQELEDFGVRFDCWYSQKQLRQSGKIDQALDYLRSKGSLYDQEGALWFRSTDFGDDKDRVVIKSDGSYTYLAPDIAYHQDKYRRGFDQLINLWGPDHHGYINRLKAAVQALGNDASSLSVVIVQLASIFREGKPVEMSTRSGQYITLREVLTEVGTDAARFFFLMRRTSSHLNFDLETAKKQTPENPVYYIQYAHARISSILRQAESEFRCNRDDLALLTQPEELALIKKLWQIQFVLHICVKTLDPYMMTVYLQETAETFHKFYDRHRVLGQEERLSRARLSLILATKIILALGLELLGVRAPEQM